MEIIIEHKGIKRVIEGTGFNICASDQDLETIVNALSHRERHVYGWIKVRDPQPDEHFGGPAIAPRPWA